MASRAHLHPIVPGHVTPPLPHSVPGSRKPLLSNPRLLNSKVPSSSSPPTAIKKVQRPKHASMAISNAKSTGLCAFVSDATRGLCFPIHHRRCQCARLNRRTGVPTVITSPATPMDQRTGGNTHLLVRVRFTVILPTTAGDQKNRRLDYPPCRVDMKTISSSFCTT